MLALRKTQPAPGLELLRVEFADPCPADGEVEVEVIAAGICGSDLHAVAWDPGYHFMDDFLPVTIGHEFTGIVTAVGDNVFSLAEGDRVVCWPTIPCGNCPRCRAGQSMYCGTRRIVGLHRDGGFAERVRVPAAVLHRLKGSIPFDIAALCEPLSIAVNAVDLADINNGDRTVVLGPGPIGAACAFVAQERGADVLLVGMNDTDRLAVAQRLGVGKTCDLGQATLSEAVSQAFGGNCDKIIEATGVASSVEQGLDLLRPGGVLVVAGIHASSCTIDLARFVREKKQLRGAHDTTPKAFAEAMALLEQKGEALSALITHRLPLSHWTAALALAQSGAAMKVLLYPAQGKGNNA